jgi:short-subunit dehydrogenase
VERVLAQYGAIDVLVNNAGTIEVGPVETMTLEDFDRAMRVMFWGVVYPTMALLPHMLERGTGRIVNITSIGGKIAVPHLLPYTCAKFAAVGFSEGLHAELQGKGVKVVTIAPGLMRTGSHLNASFKGDIDREAFWFSMGATMPGVSMSASRAARQIVAAARSGRAEKILSTPANLLARFHGLFPGTTADILGLVNRLILPSGHGRERKRGRETGALQSRWMAAVTLLGQMAARRFLQEPGRRPEPAVH